MSFWDSSALVPVLLPERSTTSLQRLFTAARARSIWWATPLECRSAIARRVRDGILAKDLVGAALERLRRIVADVHLVAPTDEVRERAERLVMTHPLRAGDALQLAAALVWCEEKPEGERFVCLDDRLCEAARREGFAVVPT